MKTMNINQMMKQAQMMQQKVAKAQEELEKKVFNHELQGIKVKMSGKKQILSIEIDESLIDSDDKEMLEDALVLTLNEAIKMVDDETEVMMSKATGNIKLPGM